MIDGWFLGVVMNDVYNDFHWVEDVPLSGFSNKALIIVQRFSRVLRQVSSRTLTLHDPMLGSAIVTEVSKHDDPRLRALFDSLIEELQKLAENRALPRYRGSVELHNEQRGKGKPVMYRGIRIDDDSKSMPIKEAKDEATEPEGTRAKKRMYRGVEI